MTQLELIKNILSKNDGIVTINDALSNNITKTAFYKYVKSLELEKIAPGIYADNTALCDNMYLLQKRYPSAILSHESALYLNDLAIREPSKLTFTVKSGHDARPLKNNNVNVKMVNGRLYEVGLTDLKTSFGNKVKGYNMERTICDLIRNKNEVDPQNFQNGLTEYFKSHKKNLNRLFKYAKLFNVENKVRQYSEVLL